MKKFFIISIALIALKTNAQIYSNTSIESVSIFNSNVLLDGSSTYSVEAGAGSNVGKGIIIPSVDLANFEFDLSLADGSTFITYFDGMIVYNNATGSTSILGNRSSTVIDVVPGFYYFSNPNGYNISQNSSGSTSLDVAKEAISGGVWTALGSGSNIKNYTTTPIKTATSIDGAQVWAVKGSFVATGTTALVSVIMPVGMTGYYKMTTYLQGLSVKTFRSDISEFKMTPLVPNTDNVVTGNGLFSEVYPAGTYDYTLEYFQ
jgi:hypothetical protein